MQAASWLVLVILAVAAPATAAPLAFKDPGEFHEASVDAHRLTWALLVFRDASSARLQIAHDEPVLLTNHTVVHAMHVEDARRAVTPDERHFVSNRTLDGPSSMTASFTPGEAGSLFVVAENLELVVENARGKLSLKPPDKSLMLFGRSHDQVDALYRDHDPGGSMVALTAEPAPLAGPIPFSLRAEQGSIVEWYNADISCAIRNECPTGGGPTVTNLPAPPGFRITSERHTYETLRGTGFNMSGSGALDYAVFGSAEVDVALDGSIRLPLASSVEPCPGCKSPDNQTLTATGNIHLDGLRPGPDGLEAELGGDLRTARFDEQAIDPDLVTGTVAAGAAAAAVTVFLLVKYALAPLFTRKLDEDLLGSERRKKIVEFVEKNPGVHFREALRGVGIPAGAGRYHVNRLIAAGLLKTRRHRSSLRLFSPSIDLDGASAADVGILAALRAKPMRVLHDWLLRNPGATQKEVLDWFEKTAGWNRSTTQGRLERLERDGVVRTTAHGRYKHYWGTTTGSTSGLADETASFRQAGIGVSVQTST